MECNRRVAALVLVEAPIIDEKGAGEARLDDDSDRARQIVDDQLCPSPTASDSRAGDSLGERPRRDLPQDVSANDPYAVDHGSADRRIEIAGDRFRLRKLWHRARARASRCLAGTACR